MLSDQPDVLQDFLKYIFNNPAIHGMMYIPLNSAIVLEIYKANRATGKPIPCTMTQLYTELCLVLLRKYLVENSDPLAGKLKGKLKDIPTELRTQVLRLGKLAFEGALQQQITFKQLPDGCVDLGFMNVSTELYLGRKYVSYSFLHLTLQEFLAAFYVSQLPGDKQKLLFIENMLINNNKKFNMPFRMSNHLDILWRFMAGLTEFKDIGWELINEATQAIISKFPMDMQYSIMSRRPLLLVHCLLEVQSEQIIRTACDTMMKEHLDAHSTDINNQFALLNTSGFEVVDACTPFDCYAVGYCVAASGHKWNLYLNNVGGNEVIEMLGYGLQSVGDVCRHFNKFSVENSFLSHEAIIYLSKFPPKTLKHMSILNLRNNQLNDETLDGLASTLSHMVSLTSLDLSHNPGSPGGMVKLFQELLNIETIKEMSIHEIHLGSSDIQALSQLIGGLSLKKLKIGDNNMSPECVASIVEVLLSSSSLENLELWWIICTPESAIKWKLLGNNNKLTSLRLINTFGGINLALTYITKALQKNESLKSLEVLPSLEFKYIDSDNTVSSIRAIEIDTVSVKLLSEMLMVNNTLTNLTLISSKLTRDNVLTLSDALQCNSTLECLDLLKVPQMIDKRIMVARNWS